MKESLENPSQSPFKESQEEESQEEESQVSCCCWLLLLAVVVCECVKQHRLGIRPDVSIIQTAQMNRIIQIIDTIQMNSNSNSICISITS